MHWYNKHQTTINIFITQNKETSLKNKIFMVKIIKQTLGNISWVTLSFN